MIPDSAHHTGDYYPTAYQVLRLKSIFQAIQGMDAGLGSDVNRLKQLTHQAQRGLSYFNGNISAAMIQEIKSTMDRVLAHVEQVHYPLSRNFIRGKTIGGLDSHSINASKPFAF